MSIKVNQIERYYDTHEVEGEEVTQSILHYAIIKYLISLLEELFAQMLVGVVSNINFYQTDDPKERPISPDVAVINGFRIEIEQEEEGPTSYYIGRHGPPPRLVFEISSEDTWKLDLQNKPDQYATMGVHEYFAFDPNLRSLWTREWKSKGRLTGWRLGVDGQYYELEKDSQGRIWSEESQSWLVVKGKLLAFYSAEGERRLTKEQADAQRARIANQQTAQERQQREAAERQAKTERQQREAAERQAEAAERQAEAERQQREAAELRAQQLEEKLAELLRQQGRNSNEQS